MCGDTPILVDTTGSGFKLSSAAAGVLFDMAGNGVLKRFAWPSEDSGNAFLVLDRNSDGNIQNGTELFGNHAPQPESLQPNGFIALAEYDKPQYGGNDDGIIDGKDAIFSQLRLWIDSNRDGVSQSYELLPLQAVGIETISFTYTLEQRRDEYGNVFRYKAVVSGHNTHTGSPFRRNIYDVVLTAIAAQ